MKELSKFCLMYCHQNHRRCANLLPQIEQCLNQSFDSSTRYGAVELIGNA